MSKLEVDKVTPQSGTTLTIGDAGDTTVINGLGTLPATIGTAAQVLSVNAGATGLQYGTAVTDLSNLNATNLTSGTVPDARFPSTLPTANGQNLTAINPTAISSGTLPALNAANLTNLNATTLTSGTVPDGRFPATLPAISGANLTNLPASGGLNKIATLTESSGHDYINIDGCFTSTYNNYLIVGKANVTFGNTNIGIRVRASGTPLTSNSYSRNIAAMFENSYADAASQTYIGMSYNDLVTDDVNWFFYVYSPKLTDQTYVSGMMTSANLHSTSFSGMVNNTTAYDGIQIFNGNTGSGDLNSSKTTVYGLAL